MKKLTYLSLFSLLLVSLINIEAKCQDNTLSVYPNPMLDKATLEIHSDNQPTEIILYNIIGKEIHRQELIGLGQNSRYEVDFSFLNPGVYFLSLITGKETLATKKIVKKR